MEENKFTCPKCGKVFMIPKSHVEEVVRVSLDGDMHNHAGDSLFAMCPSCGYVFAQENPVLIQEFAEISELPEYQAIHNDDPVLNTLFHAAFTHLYHPDVYSAAECYLTAGWYAREHHLMQEFEQSFLTAANCFLSYISTAHWLWTSMSATPILRPLTS